MTKTYNPSNLILLISVGINTMDILKLFWIRISVIIGTAISGSSFYDFDSISVVPNIGADAEGGIRRTISMRICEVSNGLFASTIKLELRTKICQFIVFYNKDNGLPVLPSAGRIELVC